MVSRYRRVRSPAGVAACALLGVAACVSLSSPRGGTGNVPVVRGIYKSGAIQPVRIILAATVPEVRIGATGEWALFDSGNGSPTMRFQSGQEVGLSTVRLSQSPVVARPLSGDSFLTWNGKRYRGEFLISATDSGPMIVNRLTMDSYLRGVVPLEIGNRTAAEFAAVQAQAVAARTYAYKHLTSSRAFDMYATVQDQVYGGVDAEKPQADSAIATTGDVVVLYNGQPITTPYSSTCGGSTAAVSEVWYNQPDQPYLRPVSDKIPGSDHYYCDPSPRFS
ncbi:MAG: SpoIID/LytB domain-containing protein, partial [Gemmatimonadales bacterium]